MNVVVATVVILLAAALTGCDEPYQPTRPTVTQPAPAPVVVTPPAPVQVPPAPRPVVPLVITYAQGTSTHSLHVQWTPALEPSVTVYWKREETDPWRVIPGRNLMRPGELQFYPADEFLGGRYRVELNGVSTRILDLDGRGNDGGSSPSPPSPAPPVVTPPSSPVPPPSCKRTGGGHGCKR